mmetsp:Transcript_81084/g.216595  ORF Transcript_81084/g.216595 Transcript_81084/m.216595 type:complete len:136 (+) Transcript_81084:939-1346(+)
MRQVFDAVLRGSRTGRKEDLDAIARKIQEYNQSRSMFGSPRAQSPFRPGQVPQPVGQMRDTMQPLSPGRTMPVMGSTMMIGSQPFVPVGGRVSPVMMTRVIAPQKQEEEEGGLASTILGSPFSSMFGGSSSSRQN